MKLSLAVLASAACCSILDRDSLSTSRNVGGSTNASSQQTQPFQPFFLLPVQP